MTGQVTAKCENCGITVPVSSPLPVDLQTLSDESTYKDAAFLKGICPTCRCSVSVLGPVVFSNNNEAFAILALSTSRKIHAEQLFGLIADLCDLVLDTHQGPLVIYATYEHFLLDQARPEIYHTIGLSEVLCRQAVEEETYALDIANDMMQAGDPLRALGHCCRLLDNLPDLAFSSPFIENLFLLQAVAQIREADGGQLQICKDLLDNSLQRQRQANSAAVWKVPYAFGEDAPTLHGVPAGYIVPATYVQTDELSSDERAIVYFLLLLFSSEFRRAEQSPSKWQRMRHGMLQVKVRRYWKEASAECQTNIDSFYREVSGGRRFRLDFSLDGDDAVPDCDDTIP